MRCDLLSGELVVHRAGPLFEAVGASMCLPAIFPPVARDGRLLVDGGVLEQSPGGADGGDRGGPVIASDVTAQFKGGGRPRPRNRGAARAWLARRVAVRGAGTAALPALKETLTRSISLAASTNRCRAGEPTS